MSPVLLILVSVALVWGAVFVVRGSLLAGCLTFLLVAACFGYEFLHFDLGPLPLTLDRLVLVVIVAGYAAQRWLRRTAPKPLGWADAVLWAFVVLLTASTFSNDWNVLRPGEVSPLWRLTGGYLIPVAIYWIVRELPVGRRQLRLAQGTLALFGAYLAVTAICEVYGQWSFVFPSYISDPKVGLHFGRARGPMVHAVSCGHYLAVCLLAAWAWKTELGRWGKLLVVAATPLALAGIYFSYTRSVWIGMALATWIVLGLTLRGRARVAVLGGLLAAGLLVAVGRTDQILGFAREGTVAETRKSVDMRSSLAYVSWLMFQDHPWLGCGFGDFPEAKLPYLADRSTDMNLESVRDYVHHNTFLSLLTETGLAGLALFIALLASWVRTAWLLSQSLTAPQWVRIQGIFSLAALAVYVSQLMFHELSYTPLDNSLAFFVGGTLASLRHWAIAAEPAPVEARVAQLATA